MEYTMTASERRVFGVLMEKALTQPDYYPMTANAVTAACNQKSNRDPVMHLDEDAVTRTLDELQQRGLVGHVLPAPGARTDRYKHLAESKFGWSARQRAVIAELLLRGPQTIGELRTHCGRMIEFDSLEVVSQTLQSLSEGDARFVSAMPREPGRSAIRHTHLLYPEGEQPATAGQSSIVEQSPAVQPACAPAPAQDEIQELREEIIALRQEVDDLTRRLDAMEGR